MGALPGHRPARSYPKPTRRCKNIQEYRNGTRKTVGLSREWCRVVLRRGLTHWSVTKWNRFTRSRFTFLNSSSRLNDLKTTKRWDINGENGFEKVWSCGKKELPRALQNDMADILIESLTDAPAACLEVFFSQRQRSSTINGGVSISNHFIFIHVCTEKNQQKHFFERISAEKSHKSDLRA